MTGQTIDGKAPFKDINNRDKAIGPVTRIVNPGAAISLCRQPRVADAERGEPALVAERCIALNAKRNTRHFDRQRRDDLAADRNHQRHPADDAIGLGDDGEDCMTGSSVEKFRDRMHDAVKPRQ